MLSSVKIIRDEGNPVASVNPLFSGFANTGSGACGTHDQLQIPPIRLRITPAKPLTDQGEAFVTVRTCKSCGRTSMNVGNLCYLG